jgi:hypothetical protein
VWFKTLSSLLSLKGKKDVAASCIFLATKTEECGRKLHDVARVSFSKSSGIDINNIPTDSKEVEKCQTAILLTEEVLLEALCFDFVVESPHAELVDLFEAHRDEPPLQDYAWSIAHDSFVAPFSLSTEFSMASGIARLCVSYFRRG